MNTSSVGMSEENTDYDENKVGVYLWIYIPPILIVVGTIGNILTIVVLSQSSMRQSTTSLYLRVLAVVDILVLNTGLMRHWIIYLTGTDIRCLTDLGCKLHVWIVYFSFHASAWMLVAVTLERMLSVMFPHKIKLRCTRKAAYAIISTILIFFLLFNAHYLFGVGINYYGNTTSEVYCEGLRPNYYIFEIEIWPWIDLTFYAAIPSSIMIVSNFCIIKKVFSSDKKATDMRASNRDARTATRKKSSMTLTLVTISAAYVMCTTPFCIFVIYDNVFVVNESPYMEALMNLLWALVNLLQYANNAVNFILYCVTGTRFRQEVMGLVCKRELTPRPTISTSGSVNTLKISNSNSLQPSCSVRR